MGFFTRVHSEWFKVAFKESGTAFPRVVQRIPAAVIPVLFESAADGDAEVIAKMTDGFAEDDILGARHGVSRNGDATSESLQHDQTKGIGFAGKNENVCG